MEDPPWAKARSRSLEGVCQYLEALPDVEAMRFSVSHKSSKWYYLQNCVSSLAH